MVEIRHGDDWLALYVDNFLVWSFTYPDTFGRWELKDIVEALVGQGEGEFEYSEESTPPETINQDEEKDECRPLTF